MESTTPVTPVTPPAAPAPDLEAIRAEAIRAENERISSISALCSRHNCADLIPDLTKIGVTVERAKDEILKKIESMQTKAPAARIEAGLTDGEKFTSRAIEAMTARALKQKNDPNNEMAGMGFVGLASEILRRSGTNPAFMGRDQIINRVLSMRSSSATPNLTISDFVHIVESVATKTMMAGWQTPSTYEKWCRIGDLPDFKAARRVNLSDAPDLLETPEGAEVQIGNMSDTGETIQLVTYARRLILTRQLLTNDDMNAFDVLFKAFGMRSINLVNSLPYAVLLANAALHDGGNLFNTTATSTTGGHANMAGTGAAISQTTLEEGYKYMKEQTAPNGSKENIEPKFLLTGSAYAGAAFSACLPFIATASAPAGTPNMFSGMITSIPDSNITGNKWFLVADPVMRNTMEVAFLGSNRAPTITQEDTSPVLGISFQAFIDATAKALDYRGMYYNAGA